MVDHIMHSLSFVIFYTVLNDCIDKDPVEDIEKSIKMELVIVISVAGLVSNIIIHIIRICGIDNIRTIYSEDLVLVKRAVSGTTAGEVKKKLLKRGIGVVTSEQSVKFLHFVIKITISILLKSSSHRG